MILLGVSCNGTSYSCVRIGQRLITQSDRPIMLLMSCYFVLTLEAKALVEEASSGGKYVERSATLDPMNGRQRWLMYEFVGNHNSSIKLSNLSGPSYAKGIEVRGATKDFMFK